MTTENTAEQPDQEAFKQAQVEARAVASFALEGATAAIMRNAGLTGGKAIAMARSHDVFTPSNSETPEPTRVGGVLVFTVFTGPEEIDQLREALTGLGYNINTAPLHVQAAPVAPAPSVILPG